MPLKHQAVAEYTDSKKNALDEIRAINKECSLSTEDVIRLLYLGDSPSEKNWFGRLMYNEDVLGKRKYVAYAFVRERRESEFEKQEVYSTEYNLSHMAVAQSHQRKRVGLKLLWILITEVSCKGKNSLTVTTPDVNLEFYRGCARKWRISLRETKTMGRCSLLRFEWPKSSL